MFDISETLAAMSMGSAVVKVKGPGRCTVKTLYLDSNKTSIKWKPSKKGNKAKSKFVFTELKGLFPDFNIIILCHQYVDIHFRTLTPKF